MTTSIFECFVDKFPFPWSTEQYFDRGWVIKDANGNEVMYCASYTGDGATIELEYDHAQALVELLNSSIANEKLKRS